MKKIFLGAVLSIAISAPAHAANEADVRGWLNQALPGVMTIMPGNPQGMESKSGYFTPTGFNGFKLTLERAELLDKPRQLGAACVIGARMAEGGIWIVDTQLVYRVPVNQIEAAPAPGDTAAPKARPNPWRYEVAQFYLTDGATANDVQISQYIPKEFPRDGFPGCRAPGEVEERASAIDEQLSFYENTMATLQERINELQQQKAVLMGAALPPGAAPLQAGMPPHAPMQPIPQTQHILNAPAQPMMHQPVTEPLLSVPTMTSPPASADPMPLHPAQAVSPPHHFQQVAPPPASMEGVNDPSQRRSNWTQGQR